MTDHTLASAFPDDTSSSVGARPDVITISGLPHPLVAIVPSNEEDYLALLEIAAHAASPVPQEQRASLPVVAAVARFAAAHPKSPWNATIWANAGLEHFQAGYFSRALEELTTAWQLGASAQHPRARLVIDDAVAQLAKIHARLGHSSEVDALAAEVEARGIGALARETFVQAKEASVYMKVFPGTSFLCGPSALGNLLKALDAPAAQLQAVARLRTGPNGYTLSELSRAASGKVKHRLIKRPLGSRIPVPSIVHWKVDHYAAIVEASNGMYHVKDPTFGEDRYVSEDVIDDQASGYFLVPRRGRPDPRWQDVTTPEAESIHGMGFSGSNPGGGTGGGDPHLCNPPPNPSSPVPPTPPLAPPTDPQNLGMCAVTAHTAVVSLNLNDTPLGYVPPRGPKVSVSLSWNQRGDANGTPAAGLFGFSGLWSSGLLSYIAYDPANPTSAVTWYKPRGGWASGTYNPSTTKFDVPYVTTFDGAQLTQEPLWTSTPTAATKFTITYPDGTQLVYAHPTFSTPHAMMLSTITDPKGNHLTFNYEDVSFGSAPSITYLTRLTSLSDAAGRNTVFEYQFSPDPSLITKATDPFGRYAQFSYDSQNRLQSITDVVGITSQFAYQDATSKYISSLTTPYGTTSFFYGEMSNWCALPHGCCAACNGHCNDGSCNCDVHYCPGAPTVPSFLKRYLSITDPVGNTKWLEFRLDEAGAGADQGDPRPQGMVTINGATQDPYTYESYDMDYLRYRNTFYWDEFAYSMANTWGDDVPGSPSDVTGATIYHWLHTHDLKVSTNALESIKRPSERRVWYNYPGQPVPNLEGISNRPTAVGRVLDDGTTQLSKYTYDATGQMMLTSTDPAGRQERYIYDSNGVDLLERDHKTPSWLAVEKYDTYVNHLPTNAYGADGLLTKFTYEPDGQVHTITDPANHVTTFNHDALGRITTVVNANSAVQKTYSYLPNCETTNPTHVNCDLPISVTDSEGLIVGMTRDAMDRITSRSYMDGTSEVYTYQWLDVASYRDRKNRTTHYTYTSNRQLETVSSPGGAMTAYTYMPHGALQSMKDNNLNVTIWGYDNQGRLAQKTYPDGTYDMYDHELTTSRLSAIWKGSFSTVKYYGYNVDDTLLGEYNEPGGTGPSTPPITYTYDPYWKRVTAMTDATGTRTYTYVPPGQPGALQVQREYGVLGASYVTDDISYSWDNWGRFNGTTIGSTSELYTFDALNRVTANNTALGIFYYTYLGQTKQLLTRTLANSTNNTVTWAYDTNQNDRRLLSITHNNGGRTYTYPTTTDPYRIPEIKEVTGGVVTKDTTYGYDSDDSLLSTTVAGSPPVTSSYATNGAGQLVTNEGAPQTYNNLNQVHVSGTTYNYDALGNRTSGGYLTSLSWDAAGHLTGFAPPPGWTTSVSYTWDGLGRPATVSHSGGTSLSFQWCGKKLCGVRNTAAPGSIVARIYDEGEFNTVTNTKLIYQKDHLGSVRDIADATSGAHVNSLDYTPFGVQMNGYGSTQPMVKFAGMFQDAASNVYLTTTRAYDAATGQFLSRDTIGEAGGINLYQYASGNPISRVDPVGTIDWGPLGGGCCNKSGQPQYVIFATGQLGILQPGECSSFWEDCDGMTCNGAFYKVYHLIGFSCPGDCNDWWYQARRWTPLFSNDPYSNGYTPSPNGICGHNCTPPDYPWSH